MKKAYQTVKNRIMMNLTCVSSLIFMGTNKKEGGFT